jgi:RimJ/RimL family protein N-acetyltransferase
LLTPIETNRLILRAFDDGDLNAFLAYRNDPDVARYQSWESISQPRAQAFIQEQKTLMPGQPGQWFQFAVTLKDAGHLIGDVGLQVLVQHPRQAQLGVSFNPAYQGQGLATEAVTAVLDYAFARGTSLRTPGSRAAGPTNTSMPSSRPSGSPAAACPKSRRNPEL